MSHCLSGGFSTASKASDLRSRVPWGGVGHLVGRETGSHPPRSLPLVLLHHQGCGWLLTTPQGAVFRAHSLCTPCFVERLKESRVLLLMGKRAQGSYLAVTVYGYLKLL